MVSAGRFFEVHLHRRATVKGGDAKRLVTSEKGLQTQREVTVSAYRQSIPDVPHANYGGRDGVERRDDKEIGELRVSLNV